MFDVCQNLNIPNIQSMAMEYMLLNYKSLRVVSLTEGSVEAAGGKYWRVIPLGSILSTELFRILRNMYFLWAPKTIESCMDLHT